ncbi:MAG: hypothetical protein AAF412_05205 [Pseudomonadota bacterium]
MPQLIGIALIGGVIWYGYRALKREMERVGRETRKAEAKATSKTVLRQDDDGVYRPINRED